MCLVFDDETSPELLFSNAALPPPLLADKKSMRGRKECTLAVWLQKESGSRSFLLFELTHRRIFIRANECSANAF